MAPTTTNRKVGHTRLLPIATIRPAPENAIIYRPVDPKDPKILELAESIRRHGIKEPLVVSADGWILSGHRRHVAAQLAGLIEVLCRIDPIRRDTDRDGFLVLLREYNRQRVKSFDETVREEVVNINSEDAYHALVLHRRAQAKIHVTEMVLDAPKTKGKITNAMRPMLDAIQQILAEHEDYLPISLRRIHYCLLNHKPLCHASKPDSTYINDRSSNRILLRIAKIGRETGVIDGDSIEDLTRPVALWDTHTDVGAFVRQELDRFLTHYFRDLMRSQPCHVEAVCEKLSSHSVLESVCGEYCIPLTTTRGNCSYPPQRDIAKRFRASGKERLVLLIASDLDPDGICIGESFARAMRDKFDIKNLSSIRVAIKPEHVERFGLPADMEAKKTSSKYKRFKAEYGTHAYELEALSPETLQTLMREAIESVIDHEAFDREVGQEKQDAAYLCALRRKTLELLKDVALE
jgi:hypothetical protein